MAYKQKKHTILLIQPTRNKTSRQYDDFETVSQAMDGICKLFESRLTSQNPNQRNITYDINQLFAFIDGLADLAALVMDPSTSSYVPHNKDWVKNRIYKHLKKMANSR